MLSVLQRYSLGGPAQDVVADGLGVGPLWLRPRRAGRAPAPLIIIIVIICYQRYYHLLIV